MTFNEIDRLEQIRYRRTFGSKMDQAKHYADDITFMDTLIANQSREKAALSEKLREITSGEHQRAHIALTEIMSILFKYGFHDGNGPVG